MTAISMFAQPARAIILADTAVTALTGELLSTDDKLTLLGGARLVVGWTGFSPHHAGPSRDRILSRLAELGLGEDQAGILQALPLILREMHQENVDWLEADRELLVDERAAIVMTVAYWDAEREEPVIAMARTDGFAHVPPYALARVAYYMTTDEQAAPAAFLRDALGRDSNPSNPLDFDARGDGLRLLERQRRIPPAPWSYGHASIGGRATLTVVDREGVRVSTLKNWGDPIGRRINPDRRQPSIFRNAWQACGSRAFPLRCGAI